MGVVLVLAIVGCLLLFYVLLWCVKRKFDRREALEDLREPLLVYVPCDCLLMRGDPMVGF